jgi:hypothetical protein
LRGLLQSPRYSEYAFFVLGSIVSGGSAVIVTVIALVFHIDFNFVILIALAVLVVGPVLTVWLVVGDVNEYAPDYARQHPSRFLTRMSDLRLSGFVLDIAAAVSALIVIEFVANSKFAAQQPFYYATIEFSLIELTLIAVGVMFWHQQPLQLLLASLRSESDHERPANKMWLDISLRNFNYVLDSNDSPVVIRSNLNLEILLFGQPLRQWRLDFLLAEIERGEYERFMNDVADLTGKSLAEILERNSWLEWVRSHSIEILTVTLTVVPVVIALLPYFTANISNIVQIWANFLHLPNSKVHELPPL